jgi:murein endopeptidase
MPRHATTIAVADGEASLLKPMDAASIGKVGALESGCLSYAPAMPFKASNWPTSQKRWAGYFSQPGMPKEICLFFEQLLTR